MNRTEWLKYRRKGLGASDAYILMLQAPKWGTPLSLYNEKVSTEEPVEKSNFITDKGQNAESKIRALVELSHGRTYAPKLVFAKDVPYVMASLDGYCEVNDANLEIKLVGKDVFEAGVCPDKYYTQIQHQYLASGAKESYLGMYLESAFKMNGDVSLDYLKIIPVPPDTKYQKKLLKTEMDFWENNVQKKVPPEPSDYDYVNVKGHAKIANKLVKTIEKRKQLEKEEKSLKKQLTEIAKEKDHPRIFFSKKLRLTKGKRIGNVDYSIIPELEKVDLEKYRKKSSETWTFAERKEKK